MAGKHCNDKDIIKNLGHELRMSLNARSNFPALQDVILHTGGLVVLSVMITLRVPFWPLLMVVHGILLVFLFTLFHETVHETAFKSRRLNVWVNRICGYILFIPPLWFKYFHLAHHRHTQDPDKDPELATPKPENLRQYLIHVSGLPTQWYNIKTLLDNAMLGKKYSYVPGSVTGKIHSEAQIVLLCYLATFYLLIKVDPWMLITLWLLPLLLGQPFLRLYLLAEHTLCPYVPSMLHNTRTTLTNVLIRRLAWNMPYHVEHHLLPSVPYHKLAQLHQVINSNLPELEAGYIPFHQRLLAKLK